jgi:hypothetical protein
MSSIEIILYWLINDCIRGVFGKASIPDFNIQNGSNSLLQGSYTNPIFFTASHL